MAKHLKKRFKVFVSDISDRSIQAKRIGVEFVSPKKAASRNVVILAMPISSFGQVLNQIRPWLRKGALIIDVCSVKQAPVRLMKELVPADVEILATHPLFGPQSGKDGISGLKIVLCPVRINRSRLNKVKRFLRSLGLKIISETPEEHDRQMSAQALAQFIAKVLTKLGVKKQALSTRSFELLLEVVDMLKDDSEQLFRDIQTKNIFAVDIRKKLIQEMIKTDKDLESDGK